jgi:hypothetical protein
MKSISPTTVPVLSTASNPRPVSTTLKSDRPRLRNRPTSNPRPQTSLIQPISSLSGTIFQATTPAPSKRSITTNHTPSNDEKKRLEGTMIDLNAPGFPSVVSRRRQQFTSTKLDLIPNETTANNQPSNHNDVDRRTKVRPRERIGIGELSFDDPIPLMTERVKNPGMNRSGSAPSRRRTPLAPDPPQVGTIGGDNCGLSLWRSKYLAKQGTTTIKASPSKSSSAIGEICKPVNNDGDSKFFGIVQGGQAVGARFAECLFVSATMCEQEFETKDPITDPGTNSSFFEGQTTMSTVSTECDAIHLDVINVRGHNGQKIIGKNRSILPQSSVSGSSSGGSSRGSAPSRKTIQPRSTYSTSTGTSSAYDNVSRALPRILKIATDEFKKHGDDQRRHHLKSVRIPHIMALRTESNSPVELQRRKNMSRHSISPGPQQIDCDVEYPTYDLVTPVEAQSTQQQESTRLNQRRPRGAYANMMGEEMPFDERPGHPNGPMYENPSEYESLRRLRLSLFLQEANTPTDFIGARVKSSYERATNKTMKSLSPELPNAKPTADKFNQQRNLQSTDKNFKKEDESIAKRFQGAMRDLEAQDNIIRNLLIEYEKTKLMLSQTQSELEARKSTTDVKELKSNHQLSLESAPKVHEWRQTEDKLIDEMNANQSLLKQFTDLKLQTKNLKDWLSNPEETVHCVTGNEPGLQSFFPGCRDETRTLPSTNNTARNPQSPTMESLTYSTITDADRSVNQTKSNLMIFEEEAEITRLRSEIEEARSIRLAAVETLVNLSKDQTDTVLETKALQRRLEKIKTSREDVVQVEKESSVYIEKKEIRRLREELGKLTKDLRVSNGLCTEHRRKASTLEHELDCTRSDAFRLRQQVEDLSKQLQLSKLEHDEKSIGDASDVKLLQDEVTRIKYNISVDSNSPRLWHT